MSESRIVVAGGGSLQAQQTDGGDFKPSNAQKLWKAKLTVALQEKGVDVRLTPLTPERIQALVPDRRLEVWAGVPGFWDWASNSTEIKVRQVYMMSQAMDALDSLLSNEELKAQSARLGAVRLLMELANAFPKKNAQEVDMLSKVGSMDSRELDEALVALGYTKEVK
jgi:hypothetical protein